MWPTYYIPFPVKPRIAPRFYLTTQPYPIEISESMQSAGAYIGGYWAIADRNEYTTNTAFLGGSFPITVTYREYEYQEAYQAATAFLGGELVTRLRTYDNGIDNYTADVAFRGGDLRRILVTYPHWPLLHPQESYKSDTAFLGGTLT